MLPRTAVNLLDYSVLAAVEGEQHVPGRRADRPHVCAARRSARSRLKRLARESSCGCFQRLAEIMSWAMPGCGAEHP